MGLCFLYLRNVKGYGWNHKRVYRIYRDLELNLRIKPRRMIKRDKPDALSLPTAINHVWSMDFMSDSLSDGRSLRTFNVIDDYNRECLTIDVDLSMPSLRVIRALEQVMEWRGKPAALRCDNGSEYISGAVVNWANQHQITLLIFNQASPLRMPMLNVLTVRPGTSGSICKALLASNTHKSLRLSDNGSTTISGRIPQSEVSRHGGYYRPHNPLLLTAV